MKSIYVHRCFVTLENGGDMAAPGGAVTLALCGSLDHAGACRWPHHTSGKWDGDAGEVRVVFVAEPSEEAKVRAEIRSALERGVCTGPDQRTTRWTAADHSAAQLSEQELAIGQGLQKI